MNLMAGNRVFKPCGAPSSTERGAVAADALSVVYLLVCRSLHERESETVPEPESYFAPGRKIINRRTN